MKNLSTQFHFINLVKKCCHLFTIVTVIFMMLTLCAPFHVRAQKSYLALSLAGIQSEKGNDLNAAVVSYTGAINLKPDRWEAYSYRAIAYYQQQRFNDAVSDITQAITLNPKSGYLYKVRGNIYFATDQYDKAIADYKSAFMMLSNSDREVTANYFNRARAYFFNKQFAEAIPDFTRAIELASKKQGADLTSFYVWRGRSYAETGSYSLAIKDLELYLAKNPMDLSANFYLGNSYLKTGNKEKATAIANQLLDMDPSLGALFNGERLLDLFDIETRRAEVKRLLTLVNKNQQEQDQIPSKTLANIKLNETFDLLNKAWINASRMTREDALLCDSVLNLLTRVYPLLKDKPALSESARKFMVQAGKATEEKKYQESLQLWNKSLSIAPYYPMVYYNRSLLKGLMENYRSAIADMNKYMSLAPDAPDVRSAKDKIYEWEGKIKAGNQSVYYNDPAMHNEILHYKPSKGFFVMRGGLSMPGSTFSTEPAIQVTNTSPDMWKDALFTKGNLGAKSGYLVELGVELNTGSEMSLMHFFYAPILLSFSQNDMNWGSRNAILKDQSVYTKGLYLFEVAQKYGISVTPAQKLALAVYFRPSLVLPIVKSQINYKSSSASDPTTFKFSAEMSDKATLIFGTGIGFSVSYSFLVLSYETYATKPRYNVNIQYHDATTNNTGGYNHTFNDVKIPFQTSRIGIAIKL